MRKILIILGILVLISCIFLVGCQEPTKTTASTPTITWTVSQDSIVIETTSEGVYYNSGSTTNNIQFYDVYSETIMPNMTNGFILNKYFFEDGRMVDGEKMAVDSKNISLKTAESAQLKKEADYFLGHVLNKSAKIDAEAFLKGN